MTHDLSPRVWDAPRPELPILSLTTLPFEGERIAPLGVRPQRLHRGARPRAESLLGLARAGGARAPVIALAALDDDEAASVFARGPELFSSTAEDGEALERLTARVGLAIVPGLASYALAHPLLASPLLASVSSPRVAPAFALLLEHRDVRETAEQWMLADARRAAVGLWPVALGDEPTMRGACSRALRWLAWMGRRDAVEDIADRYGVNDVIEPLLADDLPHRPAAITVDLAGLPALRDGHGGELDAAATSTLIDLLRATPLTPPCSRLRGARSSLSAADLDAFTLALFDRFFATGERTADRWMMHAPAAIGGEGAVLGLMERFPRLSAISPEHAAVVLDSLATMATPLALLELESLVHRGGPRAWLDHARHSVGIDRVRRGQPRYGVGPEHVPDPWEGRRAMEVSIAGRAHEARIGDRGDLVVRDDEGFVIWRAGSAVDTDDDPPREVAALHRANELAKLLLAKRLEDAMETGRAMHASTFTRLARSTALHAVTATIVYRIEPLNLLVRIAEDGSLVDLDEHTVELPRDATVCVVEAARMSRAQRRDWACRLADYEIIQVFDQVSRGLVAA